MADTATDTGREGPVGQATSHAQGAASAVQEKAGELKEQGRSKVGEQLDERTTQVGGQARQMAQALRQSGGQMRDQGANRQVAGIAEGAADRIDRLGGYLEQTSGDALLRDAEEFARRRPWLVAGVGLAVGVVVSRFLKASAERRYGASDGTGQTGRYGSIGAASATSRPSDEPISRESYGVSG